MLQRVEQQQPADERLARAEDQLDRLGRLNRADDAGQHAEHAAFGAARHEARRRRLGIEAAIARTVLGREDRRLSVEAEDAAVDVRLAEQHARVVDEVARREVVGAVDDRCRSARKMSSAFDDLSVVSCATTFTSGLRPVQPIGRRLQLRPPDVSRAVEHLPLQVAEVDGVEVDEAERADAGRREVERRRRSESAGADAEHLRRLELPLTLDADLRHDQVPAVAPHLVVRERRQGVRLRRVLTSGRRRRSGAPPATDGTMLTVSVSPTGVCSLSRYRMSRR